MRKKLRMTIIALASLVTLTACGGNDSEDSNQHETKLHENGSSHQHHSSNGELPEGLQAAKNPTFPVGSTVLMEADHMEGMNGVDATIVGAYDTTVYAVTYTPTTGGNPEREHKWVIHEELQIDDNEPLKQNSKVSLNADHMEGMQGATATIDTIEEMTVYMVDYTSSSGEKVKNHKWVTESELVEK
ncbi:hypothetical protein DCE79_07545 [Lysinibacillus sp. 2017]|uniref:YdhK family protein n=1 Tax=unclassified Lysinibacillus TaxID=2636778 RepID=UPI000D5283DC|nr:MULTISPECIES: YdhK family protein [unclassified Lysinibacillus]AWE07242.1 hypothetical protein DCE79_07545 [Lysinibacillus sp. 2017]TGN34700.1 DUF1541 domain-containing protein [Lysinibacillus sp. S2017]